ncbi:SAM-dependent methyltransferase [Actinomadura rubrisoli]|uniref:SAM-dependent methyltransferase n=1 Tax=Actinomadura rubrisoli TaxID=2530368 RepID=UPI001FB7F3BF|nr:SAM-dependent methyltransferase [Actinomadura rubrisoli]
MTDHAPLPPPLGPEIDTTVPHSARIWNYWLGGKDNYPVDRAAGDLYREQAPGVVDMARASRIFLSRAVRHLAGERGVLQFLDVGTGLPTMDNTHEVAQRAAPGARIVYVDNDPLVLTHARALLTSTPQGATDYIDADLRDPGRILREAARTLDLGRPVALMLMGVLGHIADFEEALALTRHLLDALAPGSHLIHYDGTYEVQGEALQQAQEDYDDTGAVPYVLRTPAELARLYEGLELLEPGQVSCLRWRPEADLFGEPDDVDVYGAVARKP